MNIGTVTATSSPDFNTRTLSANSGFQSGSSEVSKSGLSAAKLGVIFGSTLAAVAIGAIIVVVLCYKRNKRSHLVDPGASVLNEEGKAPEREPISGRLIEQGVANEQSNTVLHYLDLDGNIERASGRLRSAK